LAGDDRHHADIEKLTQRLLEILQPQLRSHFGSRKGKAKLKRV
jgi:hypothetical protein